MGILPAAPNNSIDDPCQSRLAVNSVTLGNFEEPLKISIFVKDLFAGFSIVIVT